MSSWARIDSNAQALAGETYRTTWYFSEPYPAGFESWATDAIKAANSLKGQAKIVSVEWFQSWQAIKLPDAPPESWALRIQWQKGPNAGSPLAFFGGPAGIITLVIIGLLVVTFTLVIASYVFEKLVRDLAPAPGTLDAVLVAGVAIALLILAPRARSA